MPCDASQPADPAILAWAREFLPHYFTDAPCEFQVELFRDLGQPARRLVARVAPRGHAKSTCAALAFPLWCICEQRHRNIVILTYEAALATQFVRDIRQELETNERIRQAYGDLCGRNAAMKRENKAMKRRSDAATKGGAGRSPAGAATAAAADEATQAMPLRRPKSTEGLFTTVTGISVQGRGSGGSFRGARVGPHRPDLIICDDLEHDAQVESPERRRRLEHWLRRVVLPALAPDGRLIVLGSLLHHDSLLANLRDPRRFPGWDYRVYRALEARPTPDGQYELVALWPARWPVARLEEERARIGTLAFEQEYQANPVDDALRVFRPEWLRRYDPGELVAERLLTVMAVDPATGVSGGDYFAVWVGSVDPATGTIYTRALTLERIGIVEQVRRIVAASERWHPLKIGIETTAYQIALRQILEEHGRTHGLYLPIVPLAAHANKRARIEGLAPFFENGTFRLPPVLDPEAEVQFLHFPRARHDDAPDVCAMGLALARALRCGAAIEGATAAGSSFARRGGW